MNITESTIKKLTIFNIEYFNDITFIIEDIPINKGRIIIEVFGEAWSAYWNNMGCDSIKDFILSSSSDYIINSLDAKLKREEDDYSNIGEWLTCELLSLRHANEITKDRAREYYNIINTEHVNNETWVKETGFEMVHNIMGDEFWYRLPKRDNHHYDYMSTIVDNIKTAFE